MTLQNVRLIFCKIWPECLVILFNFALTFCLYPSQVLYSKNTDIIPNSLEWSFLVLSLFFGTGDLLGRLLGPLKVPISRTILIAGSLLLRIPITVMILLNIYQEGWNTLGWTISTTFLLALTGGFFGSAGCTS